ncbi:MAG: carboxypeptidase regulatory-like domain-containing protein [Anaerolineae bacterium]|jgi:nitrate/TMAO reductase-like tetraheme cytochrome c subunit|nr:carboxypeptidase regulatory-like domain-containing protein [Anaerolineae bacterium]MBT7072654.1 carboxypeptidase regulatory-like domain-containing protein [Anaerolineae bacterium]MBT7991013.1 carboxypeptidase regulatory-like domain-containing protein [Anaerolineae bacterium]
MSPLKHISLLCIFFLLTSCTATNSITGQVLVEGNPVENAVVRVQSTKNHTRTDANGKFTLRGIESENPVNITAWAEGYFIGVAQDVTDNAEIHLEAHSTEDNPNYEWVSAFATERQDNCQKCHTDPADESLQLFNEWRDDTHAKSAANSRFISMYNGTDLAGNQSPPTTYGQSTDYGRFPLRPDPEKPYYGPGYKLDFPETDGNCAACHTPAASVNAPYGIDPTTVTGVATEGVTCDFCHKIWDVRLDPVSGLPLANMPGVLSYTILRPPDGHQFFAGPLDDVAPGEDTYSPLQQQSQFCAPCHFGVFWDTVIYNSFGEWLESPYSDPETGQTCQDCHMPPRGATQFAITEAGGLERDPATIFSHKMPGAADAELLQNALTMNVNAHQAEGKVVVEVELINDKTGHHIPTDSPLRQLILLVQVTDENGENLEQIEGSVIPKWGGIGNPNEGYYAGLPGNGHAKILMELWTEISPTGAYWNPTHILSDNRIPAMESDTTTYIFQTSENLETSEVSVEVKLLFRRAFIELMAQKGWDDADILMEEEIIELP